MAVSEYRSSGGHQVSSYWFGVWKGFSGPRTGFKWYVFKKINIYHIFAKYLCVPCAQGRIRYQTCHPRSITTETIISTISIYSLTILYLVSQRRNRKHSVIMFFQTIESIHQVLNTKHAQAGLRFRYGIRFIVGTTFISFWLQLQLMQSKKFRCNEIKYLRAEIETKCNFPKWTSVCKSTYIDAESSPPTTTAPRLSAVSPTHQMHDVRICYTTQALARARHACKFLNAPHSVCIQATHEPHIDRKLKRRSCAIVPTPQNGTLFIFVHAHRSGGVEHVDRMVSAQLMHSARWWSTHITYCFLVFRLEPSR